MPNPPHFDEVYRSQAGPVFSFCMRLLGDREEAMDATQETFIKAWRGLKYYRGDSSVSTWVHSIALNVCRDAVSRMARRPRPVEPDERMADPAGEFAAGVIDAAIVDEALARLPVEQREALVLCDVLGHSYAQIAELTGNPVGTVRSRIHRGRAALASILEPPDGEDGLNT